MSYILEALKKAESERQLGAVPGLHVQAAAPEASTTLNRQWILLAAGGLSILAVSVVLAWTKPWQTRSNEAAMPSMQAAETVVPQDAARSQDSASQDNASQDNAVQANAGSKAEDNPAPAQPVIVAVGPAPDTDMQPKETKKSKAREKTEKPAPQTVPEKPVAQAMTAPASMASTKPVQKNTEDIKLSTTLSADPAVGTLRDLPEKLQREIPSVTIGGYIYSETPSERQLLINRILAHEGDEVAPGLVLEKMMPKAAVFNYRGHRYQVAY